MNNLILVTPFISPLILICAAIEFVIFVSIFFQLNQQQKQLRDSLFNLSKGTKHFPDFDSQRGVQDDIGAYLDFVANEISSNSQDCSVIRDNARNQSMKHIERRSFRLLNAASIASAGVQVFPLLGILGTILALAGISTSPDGFSATAISKAFVTALDTTILGMLFAIIFTIIESAITPSIERLLEESQRYRSLLSRLLFDNSHKLRR